MGLIEEKDTKWKKENIAREGSTPHFIEERYTPLGIDGSHMTKGYTEKVIKVLHKVYGIIDETTNKLPL